MTMTYKTIVLQIPNAKKFNLATEIYKPDAEGILPIVFIFHGFTGYKESADLVDIAKRLAEAGVVAVRFTASGFGDSEGSLAHDYRFSNYRRDAEAVYNHMAKLPYVDMTRCGVYGHSLGGKLAVLFSYDHAGVKALCAVSAPVEFAKTSYGAIEEEWKKTGYMEKISSRDGKTIRVPYAYWLDAELPQHDVLAAASCVCNPHALVIAGLLDTEVPWQETERIYEALRCPKEWLLLNGVDHKYKGNAALFPVVHTPVTGFFAKYL